MKVFYWWKLSIDESCLLMKVVFWWKLSIVESCLLMKVVYCWKLFIDESCLLMKVVYWWKLSIVESCLLMKVVYWWKLFIDESFLLMKVNIVKEVIAGDVSPVAMFFLLISPKRVRYSTDLYSGTCDCEAAAWQTFQSAPSPKFTLHVHVMSRGTNFIWLEFRISSGWSSEFFWDFVNYLLAP